MKNALFQRPLRWQSVLLALSLASGAGAASAHVPDSPLASSQPAAGLRVIITPLPTAPVLRVRYESAHYGAVRLRIRTVQGQVVYNDLLRKARFAGDFDLASWPAGTYVIELETPGAQHQQTFQLTAPRAAGIVMGKQVSELEAGQVSPRRVDKVL